MKFVLRLRISDIRRLVSEYKPAEMAESRIWATVTPQVHKRGYYAKREFLQVCEWNTHRTAALCESNASRDVEMITRAALSSPDERVRLETLTVLRGVSWPTASALLHFGHPQPYQQRLPLVKRDG